MKAGYAYFESAEQQIKKKTEILLCCLLNPAFSNYTRFTQEHHQQAIDLS